MLVLFALNGFLNVLWSLLFFRLHRPDWALIEVPFLWLSVLALIVAAGALSRRSPRGCSCPTWCGSAIAAALNWETVRLNGPFGAA